MNIFDVLYVGKTGKIKPDASLTDNLYGKKFYDAHSGVITTATGNPVSIVTNKAQNAISTILSYSPKQSGSGDPSPTNIRPIEGWTEANLFGCGKNLYDDSTSTEGKYINDSGTLSTSSGYLASDYIPVARKGVYTTSGFIGSGTVAKHAFYDENKNFISVVNATQNPITMPDNCTFVRLSIRTTGMTNVQFEAGSQATDYEPFITPTTTTISLGGTYYGFSVDVERGVLRVTHVIETFYETDGWVYTNSRFRANREPSPLLAVGLNESYKGTVGNFVKIRNVNSSSRLNDAECVWFASTNNIFVRADDFANKSEFDTFIAENPLVLVMELAEPIELPITPQTVALLAGNNTLWTDGDSIEITYKAKRG